MQVHITINAGVTLNQNTSGSVYNSGLLVVLVLTGNGTVTGLAVGGKIPDGTVDAIL